jgi:hypothetical protein
MATADARAESLTAPFVFPFLREWDARGKSLRLAASRHVPTDVDILPDLKGHPAALPRFHEDLAANPVQAGFALSGLLLLFLGWPRLGGRARWAGAALLCAWVLFHATFRPNRWISRLETPLFALVPLSMGSWAILPNRGPRQAVLGTLGVATVALGILAAIHNPPRPALEAFSPRDAAADYYVNRPSQRRAHDAALDAAARTGCPRIGLFIGEDSYDYPLTWRAMKRGIEIRHVLGPDRWPCVLMSDRGIPPPTGPGEATWEPVLQIPSRGQANASVAGGVWIRKAYLGE